MNDGNSAKTDNAQMKNATIWKWIYLPGQRSQHLKTIIKYTVFTYRLIVVTNFVRVITRKLHKKETLYI